jgi:glycosyltransferase involved in cell wall biosynthesis
MKIGIIANGGFFPISIGGISIITFELASNLAKAGHDVLILLTVKDSSQQKLLPQMNHVKYICINLSSVKSFLRNFFGFVSALNTLRRECDIIHYPSPPVTFDIFLPFIFRLFRKKQTYWYLGDVHNYPRRLSLFKINQNFLDKIIVSYSFIYSLSRNIGIPAHKLEYVSEPADVELFKKSKSTPLTGYPSVLYVGRLHPDKDLVTLLNATRLVKVAAPKVHLHIVGGGTGSADCERLIKELELNENVTLHGQKSYFDLPPFYKGATMVVYPIGQYFSNGPGLVAFEAFASGTPLLTTIHAGGKELLKDGVNSLLSNYLDFSMLAKNMLKIHFDRTLASEISKNGLQLVSKFDWSTVILDIEGLWQKLVVTK